MKKIQLNRRNSRLLFVKKTEKQSNKKSIEEDMKQTGTDKKRETKTELDQT